MKITIIVLSVIAVGLIVFNVLMLNFDALFQGESMTAVIMILASLCALVLLQILSTSRRIEQLSKESK